ncbi:hypothetical protein AV530_008704 [Patagioenas fasciata monilis]|uniref:Uncharacterized protein n=1 Tax=Patagioenas fasciata monilis TaxID=372326 RepID=A0A1V4L1M0_PATFA|nr:hypothetical protein AV530_008704 [Patagioenas fasciata monilis]
MILDFVVRSLAKRRPCCFMFLEHYIPQLLASPLPSWGNSIVCIMTKNSDSCVGSLDHNGCGTVCSNPTKITKTGQ